MFTFESQKNNNLSTIINEIQENISMNKNSMRYMNSANYALNYSHLNKIITKYREIDSKDITIFNILKEVGENLSLAMIEFERKYT